MNASYKEQAKQAQKNFDDLCLNEAGDKSASYYRGMAKGYCYRLEQALNKLARVEAVVKSPLKLNRYAPPEHGEAADYYREGSEDTCDAVLKELEGEDND